MPFVRLFCGTGSSSVSIVTRLWAGRPDFDSWQRQWLFLFGSVSRPAHTVCLTVGTVGCFSGDKSAGAWRWPLMSV